MRRLLLLLAVALCMPAQAAAGTLFLIDGRGWGHGVGMSQYGARGYARAGWGYERILAHYYRGTELSVVPARRVRVLLAERRPAVKIGSTKPFRVVDARGKVRKLFYHSTSGGKTAAVAEVWPRATAVPYLVSVPDPYDSLSKHHRWGPVRLTPAQVGKKLGLAPVRDLLVGGAGRRAGSQS
jgi:hypothetical protein